MTDAEYWQWAEWYGDLFGLRSEADARMLASWGGVLARRGYSLAELREAAEWLLVNKPPEYRGDHLPRLVARVEAVRRESLMRDRSRELSQARICSACGSTGWVIVPHPADVIDAQWLSPWRTAAVACECARGCRLLDALSQSPPIAGVPWRLSEYADRVLRGWREAMDRRAAELAELAEVGSRSEGQFAEVIRGVLKRKGAR